jgi:dihydrofolate reductase
MRLSLLAAVARNGVIGRDNQLPWHLSPDLKRFKRLTMGHAIIMGRKTFESIGRPLPGRANVVVTRRDDWRPDGVVVAHSIEDALAQAVGDEVFVIGGEDLFRQTIGRADRLHLTRLDENFPGDTFFPEVDPAQWRLVEREDHGPDADAPFAYSFLVYDRKTEE